MLRGEVTVGVDLSCLSTNRAISFGMLDIHLIIISTCPLLFRMNFPSLGHLRNFIFFPIPYNYNN